MNVIDELNKDKRKTFVFGNIGFLKIFFEEKNFTEKIEELKLLVASGRVEIMNHAVSSHDEACNYYTEIIQNIFTGKIFLNKNFKTKFPLKNSSTFNGWMIDSFGHSKSNPKLLKSLGAKSLIINRIDSAEKAQRRQEQRLFFDWCKNKKF